MPVKLKHLRLVRNLQELAALPAGKLMINTINAHSYNVAQRDERFAEALQAGELVPDGASIVKACRWLKADFQPSERIAGWDLFQFEMNKIGEGKCVMFMGSSPNVLQKIEERMRQDYPTANVVTYSPPYKPSFNEEENQQIIDAINRANPDLLWIGMTAPKQEKWVYDNWTKLDVHCHVGAIGAVFDFYAGTLRRAPIWWQRHGLEWLHRLLKEPRRMWRRYLVGNTQFMYYILKEKLTKTNKL